MAIPIAALAYTGIVAGSQIMAGFSAMKRKDRLADDYLTQGRILYQESMREAAIIQEEAEVFAQEQGLAYIGSGVELMGSALLFPAETRSMGAAKAEAVRSRGQAAWNLYSENAATVENEGRASMISSLFKAASSFVPFLPMPSGKVDNNGGAGTDIYVGAGQWGVRKGIV